jgi:hypothetical protein
MMGGDYGQDEGICVVKLDRKDQGLDCPGVGTYVYVHPDNIGTDNEKGGE